MSVERPHQDPGIAPVVGELLSHLRERCPAVDARRHAVVA
jgi:hypothetical protein